MTRQVCQQLGVRIIEGIISAEHVHLFVEIPPKHSVSDFIRRVKGCTSRKIQQEFPELRKRYWGRGVKIAMLALARRIAIVLHRIWVDGEQFRTE